MWLSVERIICCLMRIYHDDRQSGQLAFRAAFQKVPSRNTSEIRLARCSFPVDTILSHFNPLNAELNPICHLLVLLGDLIFIGPCISSIFQYTCISNRLQSYTVYLYLETALHVSGGNFTHHQERIQLHLQHLICHTVTAICRYRGRVGTGLSVLWVAYASTLNPVPTLPR
jgi:hypothetical protein